MNYNTTELSVLNIHLYWHMETLICRKKIFPKDKKRLKDTEKKNAFIVTPDEWGNKVNSEVGKQEM